jgi:hypothetical protein
MDLCSGELLVLALGFRRALTVLLLRVVDLYYCEIALPHLYIASISL